MNLACSSSADSIFQQDLKWNSSYRQAEDKQTDNTSGQPEQLGFARFQIRWRTSCPLSVRYKMPGNLPLGHVRLRILLTTLESERKTIRWNGQRRIELKTLLGR